MADPLTPIERSWGAALQQEPGPECLTASALIALADRGRRGAEWNAGMRHIAQCPTCREAYRQTLTVAQISRSRRRFSFLGVFLRPALAYPLAAAVAAGALWLALVRPLQRQLTAKEVALTNRERALAAAQRAQEETRREVARAQAAGAGYATRVVGLEERVRRQEAQIRRLRQPPEPALREARLVAQLTHDLQAVPDLAELRVPVGVFRGNGEAALPSLPGLSPARTRVAGLRPTLRWSPVPGAQSYEILVQRLPLLEEAAHARVAAPPYVLPRPLAPGATYRWSVVAHDPSGVAQAGGQAVFATLTVSAAGALSRASREPDPLARAALLARLGLREDAVRLAEAYRTLYPGSASAALLLRRLAPSKK